MSAAKKKSRPAAAKKPVAAKPRAKRRATRTAKPKPTHPDRAAKLELFLRTIAQHFWEDSVTPGLVISYLPASGLYYGSVTRYKGPTKTSLINHKAESLLDVLTALSARWKAYLDYHDIISNVPF